MKSLVYGESSLSTIQATVRLVGKHCHSSLGLTFQTCCSERRYTRQQFLPRALCTCSMYL